jgi:hypothetical protein
MPAMSSSPRRYQSWDTRLPSSCQKKKLSANLAIASLFLISRVRSNAVHAWPKNPWRDVI